MMNKYNASLKIQKTRTAHLALRDLSVHSTDYFELKTNEGEYDFTATLKVDKFVILEIYDSTFEEDRFNDVEIVVNGKFKHKIVTKSHEAKKLITPIQMNKGDEVKITAINTEFSISLVGYCEVDDEVI